MEYHIIENEKGISIKNSKNELIWFISTPILKLVGIEVAYEKLEILNKLNALDIKLNK